MENDLTNKQKTLTAMTAAKLQEALKNVDVARETVTSETGVKVANITADGAKQAAEIDAQRDLEVAKINLDVANLEAKRTQILGKAEADVTQMKSDAEAKGAKMLVDAFGSAAGVQPLHLRQELPAERPQADLRRSGNFLDRSEDLRAGRSAPARFSRNPKKPRRKNSREFSRETGFTVTIGQSTLKEKIDV